MGESKKDSTFWFQCQSLCVEERRAGLITEGWGLSTGGGSPYCGDVFPQQELVSTEGKITAAA